MHHGCVAGAARGGRQARVVVDVAKLAAGRQDYYTREIANNHEEYLSGQGESPGRWYGQGAASLGQSGDASTEAFGRIFEGRHPHTGELLGRPHGRHAVPAFDVVFRPTKSVSILYGLGDAAVGRAVLAAHHAELAEAVTYLDGHLGARRGHGGAERIVGNGCWQSGSTTAPRARATRCCTPTWWWPTASRARTAGGRRWTAATCTGTAARPMPSTGRPTSAS
jgi:TrwC relaxase